MKRVLFQLLLLISVVSYAVDFKVNGINYNILSYQETTVAVAPVERGATAYSGDIVIPSTVSYGGRTWTVVELADEAFWHYSSGVTSMKLPSTLKRIGKNAFNNNTGIAPFEIPKTVEYIGEYSFCGVKILGTLPDSLRILGEWAFSQGHMDKIIIPKHLKEIPVMAFGFIEDAPVTFNDSVESIGGNAFYDNKTFVNLVIPESVKKLSFCFQGCTNIETVQLPEGLLELGSYNNLPKLHKINIPDSITTFVPSAFANCSALKEMHWPKFLSSIQGSAFKGTGLKVVRFPEKLYTMPYPIYNRWDEITGYSEITDKGHVSIGNSAFYGCMSLDSVYITDVISSIGTEAFAKSTNIKAIVVTRKNLLKINQNVFSADTYLGATLYVPYGTSETYRTTSPWSNFGKIVELPKTTYNLIYKVDNEVYKSYEIECGATITPEPAPTKEGYSFSGWSEIPETMPAHDVTVTGAFTINKYKLIYKVDDADYKTVEVDFGAAITPEPAPTKEGYTFSGWSEIPETMPAHDVTVTGTFAVNKYKLIFKVDDAEYKTYEIEYGAAITPEPAPTKEGYTFSGWSEIPETMPAHDVTVTGTFAVNKYKLIYKVDDVDYKTVEVEFESTITPEPAPTKEGYSFSGWSEIPETMPAHDVTVTGSFTVNKYKLIYMIDNEVYKTYEIEYGASIIPEPTPTKEGYTFSGWSWIPSKMPAEDVTITGTFTANKYKLTYIVDGEVYKSYDIEFGAIITPEPTPIKEGYTFSGWSWIPSKMPAEDVTVTGTFIKDDIVVDGVTFEETEDGVILTNGESLNGSVIIPATIMIKGKTYQIIAIGEGAFKGNTAIISVTISNGINRIGASAFEGCSNLSEIILGAGIRFIGAKAFAKIVPHTKAPRRSDKAGVTVSCYATSVPETDAKAFEDTPIDKATLLVNDDLINDYCVTEPWKNFGTIQGFNGSSGIDAIWTGENSNAKIYTLDGKLLDEPQKGLNIVRMSNGAVKKVVVK